MPSIVNQIKKHFASDPFYFWSIIVLMAVNPVASQFYMCEWVDFAIMLALIYCSATLFTTVFSSIGRVGVVLKYLSVTIIALYDAFALFCLIVFDTTVDATIIETLLETNVAEIKEFVSVFMPWWLLAGFVALLVALFYGYYYCKSIRHLAMGSRQIAIHQHLLLYVVIVLLVSNRLVVKEIRTMSTWTIPFENIAINLKDHEPQHLHLKECNKLHPEKIVVVIGESHAKAHSSIYGYDKATNPRLQQLISDSLLYAFRNVESPATGTVQAFKYIMTTRRLCDVQTEWYKFPSIITIMKSAGYRTSWYSNQNEVGLHDNLASSFAHICDEYHFNSKSTRLDGDILGLHKPIKGKEFVVYHLMGQHVDFAKRYPESFQCFKATDYDKKKFHKREVAAHYDNACLYNDYVVSQIMNMYKNEDAIVVYFPDHGLDVFQSSPTYFGHARRNKRANRKIGHEIPCFVYTSSTFKARHKDLTQQIKQSVDRKYNTAEMPFTLMHVAGYDFAAYPADSTYTLFR